MALANMTQEETNEYNRNHCKDIAERLDVIASGEAYTCPYCGETINAWDYSDNEDFYNALTDGEEVKCPHCGETDCFDQTDMFDYIADALDITYTINSDMSYRGGSVMVAWGGPSIYVDTNAAAVKLYWWSDRAEYPLSTDAVNALDDCLGELYEMNRGC